MGAAVVSSHIGGHRLAINRVIRQQRGVHSLGLAIGPERPDHLPLIPAAELLGLRHRDGEEEGIATGIEVGWLALIGVFGIEGHLERLIRLKVWVVPHIDDREMVVGADRQLELLLPVLIEVAEPELDRPVFLLLPPVEGRRSTTQPTQTPNPQAMYSSKET